MSGIRLIKPYISYDEVEEDFRAVFASGIFTRGANVESFRQEIARYTGARHVHLATSATTGLWACLRLLDIGPGDEVLVSDFSFPASANVVEDLGARPVFVDVSRETYNVLPGDLERKLTPRTKAVIFVDALGNPAGAREVKAICERRGVPMIEDAACAMGSSEGGVRCGAIADLTVFSFHPRKLICTGEGGAITTDREDWSRWLDVKLMHGASGMKGSGLDFIDFGYNFRLPELQAIMGRAQLRKLDAVVDSRLAIRRRYVKGLAPLGFTPQAIPDGVRHNVQSQAFAVPSGCDRGELIGRLKDRGIETTIGTYALSDTTFYRKRYATVQPNSKWLNDNVITVPCFEGVDVERVVEAIGDVIRK